MAARVRRWTPLVRRAVPPLLLAPLLLLLVTGVGHAGPLREALLVPATLELLEVDVALSDGDDAASTAGPTWSPTVSISGPTGPPTVSTSGPTWAPTVSTSGPTGSPTVSTPGPTGSPTVSTSTAPPYDYCPDPHERIEGDSCECYGDYRETADPDRMANNTCRKIEGGYLGASCHDVSDCNYRINHAACEESCQCIKPYVGFNGEFTCFDNAMGWGVAIKTAGITVLVLAVGFFIAFGVKGCSRSIRQRLGRRVPWLRRTSDISFNSGDFFLGSLGQAILDRPPSYAEEDVDKPPAYEEIFPDEEGIVNIAFSPDSPPPGSPERQQRTPAERQRPQRAAVTAEPRAAPVTWPAVRGHRRGLSGPAAIHLGTSEQSSSTATEQVSTAAIGQSGTAAASEQASTTADAPPSYEAHAQTSIEPTERLSTVTPEETASARCEQVVTDSAEQTSADSSDQTNVESSEQTNVNTSDRTEADVSQQSSTNISEQPSPAEASEQTALPTSAEQNSCVAAVNPSVRTNAAMTPSDSRLTEPGEKSGDCPPAVDDCSSAAEDCPPAAVTDPPAVVTIPPAAEPAESSEVWEDVRL